MMIVIITIISSIIIVSMIIETMSHGLIFILLVSQQFKANDNVRFSLQLGIQGLLSLSDSTPWTMSPQVPDPLASLAHCKEAELA